MVNIKQIVTLAVVILCALGDTTARVKDWYETTTIYQLYPRSFKDSDGDGVGDLRGILEKLDYMQSIGIETLWIQSFFQSPMLDCGYDVSDHKRIDPIFGTLDDFKELVAAIHKKGMKVMIDFVPNHTSNESEWFIKSANREEPYTDFYVWKDPKGYDTNSKPIPPNNWLTFFTGSAWEWNEKRHQFYLRQFAAYQPDLNYHNPKVRAAMEDILRYWLDLGVDGFRVDAIQALVEDKLFRDNPWKSPKHINSTRRGAQIQKYTYDQDETYEVTHEWRLVLDEYKAKDNKTRIMAPEVFGDIGKIVRYFGNETYKNMHFPFYLELLMLNYRWNSTHLDSFIHMLLDNMPADGVPNWTFSNHDWARVTDRIDPTITDAMTMLLLLLPGVANIYYGEEIGMQDTKVRSDQLNDKSMLFDLGFLLITRDSFRAPMQWDDSTNAGFTSKKKPWLPVNSDYWTNNVKKQTTEPRSHLNLFKDLMRLRKSTVIVDGETETAVLAPWLHMLVRKLDDQLIVVITNLGAETETVCINGSNHGIDYLPHVMKVLMASSNSRYTRGDKFVVTNSSGMMCSNLRPKAGVVLTTAAGPSPRNDGLSLFSSSSFPLLLLLSSVCLGYQSFVFK